jgi:hypothetical protein
LEFQDWGFSALPIVVLVITLLAYYHFFSYFWSFLFGAYKSHKQQRIFVLRVPERNALGQSYLWHLSDE